MYFRLQSEAEGPNEQLNSIILAWFELNRPIKWYLIV